MAGRLRVFELAKELGTSSRVVINIAQKLDLNVIRGVAQLTPRQEQLIRDEFYARATTYRRPPQPRPTPVQEARPRLEQVRCPCCRLGFEYLVSGPDFVRPHWCRPCQGHYQKDDEPAERTIARLSDHEQRTREAYKQTGVNAAKYYDEMKRAFASRQKWKIALVDIALGHDRTDSGACSCGAKEYPCVTLRALEHSNRGIAREVDRLSSLPPDILEAELYRDDPWRINLAVDDDPIAAQKHNNTASSVD